MTMMDPNFLKTKMFYNDMLINDNFYTKNPQLLNLKDKSTNLNNLLLNDHFSFIRKFITNNF